MLIVDRYNELHRYHRKLDTSEPMSGAIPPEFLAIANICQDHLSALGRSVALLRKLCDELTSVTAEAQENIKVDQVHRLSNVINSRLMDVKESLANLSPMIQNPIQVCQRMQTNIHNQLLLRFKNTLELAQSLQTEITSNRRLRIVRLLQIASPGSMSTDEASLLVDQGVTGVSAMTALLESNDMETKLINVQSKVSDLQRLHGLTLDLRQCFLELSVAVDAQGGITDSIEYDIINTKNHMGVAELALISAEQKQRRKLKIYLWLFVCLFLLAAILVISLLEHLQVFRIFSNISMSSVPSRSTEL